MPVDLFTSQITKDKGTSVSFRVSLHGSIRLLPSSIVTGKELWFQVPNSLLSLLLQKKITQCPDSWLEPVVLVRPSGLNLVGICVIHPNLLSFRFHALGEIPLPDRFRGGLALAEDV